MLVVFPIARSSLKSLSISSSTFDPSVHDDAHHDLTFSFHSTG